MAQPSELAAVIEAVLASKKYRMIDPHLVEAVARAELAKRRSRKEAIKATKNQLHQSAAAYQSTTMDYSDWLTRLSDAYAQPDLDLRRAVLQSILAHHASTQERLPFLADFYAEIFRHLPPIQSVIDVACGLNPLAHAWMSLPATAQYTAYDIYRDQIDFLNGYFQVAGIAGHAAVRDVVQSPPTERVDLALVLKTLPCLEQIDTHASARLLECLHARYLVVSFPIRSLGGRSKGMGESYRARFQSLVGDKPWLIQELEIPGELTFLVTT